MSRFKRCISLLLVLGILLGVLAPAAQAAPVEETATVNADNVTIEGTNGFGDLLAQEVAENQQETETQSKDYPGGYSVTDLQIVDNVATVTYDTMEEATLVVALYTEDGMQLLTSAKATVTPENTEASVTFEDEIPEYFMASAYLMDSYDLSPLCAAYDTPMYTRQMQELLASTVDDYDPEKVLNLDDDDTTNFAVYADSTIVIEPEDGVNTVASIDDENAVYVIKNADEQITALREGDVFVYSYAEGEMLIVKVETITINGTTATITGSELELEEVFSHMKIENTGSTEDMIVDENSGDEGVTYIGLQPEDAVNPSAKEGDAELQFSMGFDVEKEIDRYSSFSGSLGVQLNIEFEYYISLKRQFIRLEYGYEVATKIAYQFQAGAPIPKATAKLELKSFGYMPLPYVLIGFEPEVVVEFTATVEVSCTLSGSGGFAFEGGKGVDDLTRKPTVDVDIKFEGVIFFGIDLGPHISILKDKIAKIKLSSQVGLELTGKSTGSLFEDIVLNGELPKEKHECELCIAVDLAIKADFSVKIELLKCDWLTWEFKLAAKAFKIGACYYSETYSDFGFGTCPHKLYRVTVVVTDTESQRASGVQVAIGDLKGDTAENGVICFYLPEGTYTIEATDGTLTRSKKITLNAAQKVTVSLSDDPDNHILDQAGMDISIDHSMTARGEFGGNQYQLFDVSMTWPEAKAYCESLGGHLATITSAEEQAYIESLMEAGGKKQYWIGMQYIDRDYRWITGEPVVYTNWDWRMPDGSSYNDLREDYVHILNQPNPASANSKRFHWNDMYYDNIFRNANELDFFNTCYVGFICELESEQPTEVTVFTNNEPDYRVHAVYPGDYGTEITDTYTLKTAGFKNLVPGEQYVLLAMAGIAVEDPLAADNLLFIDQAAASEDGTLAFEYVQRTPCDISYVVACGASNKNLNDAEITFPEMTADGELQVVDPVVVYDGKTLTEGRDYIVLDKVDFTGAGEYVCFIRGIHNYTGLVECPYIVTGDDYIISYNANGGNGAPVSQTKEPGVPLTISSVVPTRFGYTFLGWATSSNATAASYLPGGSFTINADTVLYAVWQSAGTIPANVTSSSFSASIPFSDGCQYFAFTPSFTGKVQFESTGTGDPRLYIYDSGGNKIAYNDDSGEGYNFLLTFPVTSGTKYYAMVKFYSSGMGTVNFTVKRAYDIVYDANGGSGAPSTQTKIHGTALTLSSDIPTRAGYTFLGWSTNSSAAAAVYQPGSSFSSNADTTLYAVWGNGVSETYTITYNANGGYGAPDPQNVPSGEVRRISSIVPNRFPYSFLGWSTSSAATSVTYLPGDLITITRDITLYAVWEEACSISPNVTNVSHDVMIPFAEGDKFYKFTPGTSMKCIFESSADDMTQIVLFNEEGAMLTLDYGTLSDLNFSLQYDVTAGTTYYLSVGYLGFGHGTFSFKVSRAYDITYDANGGTDAPASQIAKHDTPLMLSSAVPNRFGYTFLGWSADSSDAYADFLPGDSFTTDADVTLYAIWREATPIMSREHTAVTSSTARITFADGYHFYKIVPTFTGKVQVESSGADDPVIYLYDAQANQLAWDDDSGEGNNFKLTHSLTIATTYYVKVKYNSSHTGTISLMMSRAFDVTYDANGGSGAPDRQLYVADQILYLSDVIPVRSGYTFLGWATDRNAKTARFQPGEEFDLRSNTILYAVWKENCDNGHSYSYAVTKAPTTSATGTLTGTCSKCNGTTTVTLPRLNTADYTYKVTKAATCTAAGTGRYTWKTITYGSFYFDVSIAATGHSYDSVVTAPTCTKKGYTTHTCHCGDSYNDSYTDSLGHSFTNYVSDGNATCTQDGTKTAVCDRCDATDTKTDVGSARGHDFSSWTVAVNPTPTSDGLETRCCNRCGYEEQRAIPKIENPFTDVPMSSFYYAPVLWAVENGITNGATATTFNPNGQCLRAHVVTFLHRAAGSPAPDSSRNPFTDVKIGDFFYKPVLWAVENGITNGVDAATFGSYDVCNRAAVVTFLWRAAGSPEPQSTSHPFVDVKTTDFFYKPVLWAVENEITNGIDATHFGPTADCNRAQVVTFLYRAFNEQ